MISVNAPDRQIIELTNSVDEPVFNGFTTDGSPKPVTHSYQQFLLARTADETFAEHGTKKEGLDLLELVHLARQQIRATKGKSGPHLFDSEVAKRIQAAIFKPKNGRLGNPEFEHNWYEWAILWKDIKENPAVVATELSDA